MFLFTTTPTAQTIVSRAKRLNRKNMEGRTGMGKG
jgi:hypothetical protein